MTDALRGPLLTFGNSGWVYVTWSNTDATNVTQGRNGGAWEMSVRMRAFATQDNYEYLMQVHAAEGDLFGFFYLSAAYMTVFQRA